MVFEGGKVPLARNEKTCYDFVTISVRSSVAKRRVPCHDLSMGVAPPLVSIKDLHKSYDATPVLKGVSPELEQGDLVSIIGPSGCGKSTFLRCMNFLEIPDAVASPLRK